MRKLCLLFFLLPVLLSAKDDVGALTKRVYAHAKIHDATSAVREAKLGLESFPQSLELQRALIFALSVKGEEIEALSAWKAFSGSFTEEKTRHLLLENLLL